MHLGTVLSVGYLCFAVLTVQYTLITAVDKRRRTHMQNIKKCWIKMLLCDAQHEPITFFLHQHPSKFSIYSFFSVSKTFIPFNLRHINLHALKLLPLLFLNMSPQNFFFLNLHQEFLTILRFFLLNFKKNKTYFPNWGLLLLHTNGYQQQTVVKKTRFFTQYILMEFNDPD